MNAKRCFRWRYDLQRWQATDNGCNFLMTCRECGQPYAAAAQSRRCGDCTGAHVARLRRGTASAHVIVLAAVRLGQLPPASTQRCVDCNAPALVYDHRDYSKPLQVEPVCGRHNKLRGSGKRINVPATRTLQ